MQFSGRNSNDIFNMNQSTLLHLIQRSKICSRVELARNTGLTQAAITKIISKLLSYGIIEEVGLLSSTKGRRAIGLQISESTYAVIGIKIARDSVMTGLFTIGGCIYRQDTLFENLLDGPEVVFSAIREKILQYLAEDRSHQIVAIGAALAGPYLKTNDELMFLTGFTDWEHIFIKKTLQEGLSIPLFVEHDAKASTYAEWLFDNIPSESRILATLIMNQGLGAGVIIDGNLLRGSQGIASEIGHISVNPHGGLCRCGNYGCLEMYCTTTAILQEAQSCLKKRHPSRDFSNMQFEDVISAYHTNDPDITPIIDRFAGYIRDAVLILIRMYNPDQIILGDKLKLCGDSFLQLVLEKLHSRISREIWENITIRYSDLPVDSSLYGAAAMAIYNFLENPKQFLET